MALDINIKIAGAAGQGIQTVGNLLALVFRKAGFYILAINDFESRIRGGQSSLQIRVSDRPVLSGGHETHLLALLKDDLTDVYGDNLAEGALSLVNTEADGKDGSLSVPFVELAKQAGGSITANTVAASCCLGLLGAPFYLIEEVITQRFAKKSPKVTEQNIKAAQLGFEAVKNVDFQWKLPWNKKATPKGNFINASKAVALGALASDCRFGAFYPMSPATGVMRELVSLSDKFPILIEQAEDELAAINMIVGASFAGVRSLTSTSGGGFCLMTEGLGLAAMSETPVVIVNAQRPGPATGLPTRTQQGDLMFAIRASQDEFPRFVFAPGNMAEAYRLTIKAFDLSEKYQVPSIILTDQYLADSLFMLEESLEVPKEITRHIARDQDLENPEEYQRFAITDSGISPRALPCRGKALVTSTGNEHTPDGHVSENSVNRKQMVDKRNAKIPAMTAEMSPPLAYHENSEILLVGWGSTQGAIREAVDILRTDGWDVGCLHFVDMWPFPTEAAKNNLEKAGQFWMVEQNSSAQLGQLIREQTALSYSESVLKYDGRQFSANEIVNKVKHIKGKSHGISKRLRQQL